MKYRIVIRMERAPESANPFEHPSPREILLTPVSLVLSIPLVFALTPTIARL